MELSGTFGRSNAAQWAQRLIAAHRFSIQNLSGLIIFNFAASGLFFITHLYLARWMGKESFGLLAYGLVVGNYGMVFVRYGMDNTLVRDLVHYPDRFGEIVVSSYLLRLVLLCLFAVGLAVWKIEGMSAQAAWGVKLAALATALKAIDMQPVYDAWRTMTRHALYNFINRVIYALAVWILILSAKREGDVLGVGVCLLASALIYQFMQHAWVKARLAFEPDWRRVASSSLFLLRENIWMFLATLCGVSFTSVNQLFLKSYAGLGELGRYAAAWQIALIAQMLIVQIARMGRPGMAAVMRPGVARGRKFQFLGKYTLVMTVLLAPPILAMFLMPGFFVHVLFGAEYAGLQTVVRLLSVYIALLAIGVITGQYILAARLEKSYFASTIAGGILTVLLACWIIKGHGANGAAWTVVLGYGSSIACQLVITARSLLARDETVG
jgi:O-antigen/teichoic acid export membrane protein